MALYHTAQGTVTYTVQGEPTVIDGIASNFSNTSYLQIAYDTLALQNILVHVRFTTGALDDTPQIIYQCGPSGEAIPIGFRIHSDNRLVCYHAGASGSQRYTFANLTLEEGKTYDVEFGAVNTVRYFKAGLADNMSDQTISAGSDSDFDGSVSRAQFFGFAQSASSGQQFNGSVDLNRSFVRIDGKPYFGLCPIEVKAHQIMGPVGYVTEGNPIITNGIASISATTDFVKTSQQLTWNTFSNIEFGGRFKSALEAATGRTVLGRNGSYTAAIIKVDEKTFSFRPAGASNLIYTGFGNVELGTWYRYKIVGDNGTWTVTLYADDGTTVIGSGSRTYTESAEQTDTLLLMAYYASIAPVQYIDLNHTYVKKDGVLWYWQPQPTKKIYRNNVLVWEAQ